MVSVMSVASESSKLWSKVYADPNHSLYGIHLPSYYSEDGGRRLDEDYDYGTGDIASYVLAGAMAGFVAITELISDDPSVITTNPVSFVITFISAAVPAAMSEAGIGGSGGGGG